MWCVTVVPHQELVQLGCATFVSNVPRVPNGRGSSTRLNLHVEVMEGNELTVVAYVVKQHASVPVGSKIRVNIRHGRCLGRIQSHSLVVFLDGFVDVLSVVGGSFQTGVSNQKVLHGD